MLHVSIVTPTYHRRKFIPTLITIYANQTYPKEHMEWIIIDDGQESVEDLFTEAATRIPNIHYIRVEEKLRIGAKRNRLNQEARAPIIISMDDDDYYPPERVQMVVDAFTQHPHADLVGSSEMNLYYIDDQTIYTMGPFMPNHATNGTLAYRKRYAEKHRYDEFVTKAEEVSFLETYTYPMIQMDPMKTILVICHDDNTVDKQSLRKKHLSDPRKPREKMRVSSYTLSDIVKEPSVYDFYKSLQ
jgi:glycosyltransferase involved in cell wall biosynthesis